MDLRLKQTNRCSLSCFWFRFLPISVIHTPKLREGNQEEMVFLKIRSSSLSLSQRGSPVLSQCLVSASEPESGWPAHPTKVPCEVQHLHFQADWEPKVVLTTGQWTLRRFICNLQDWVTSSIRQWSQTGQLPLPRRHYGDHWMPTT